MTLAQDTLFMIMNGPEPAELVTYLPYKGIPVQRYMTITRRAAVLDFSTPVGEPIIEYAGVIVNDADAGVVLIQDGKDQVQFKKTLGDRVNSVFRVVSHESDTGAHSLVMRV